MDEMIQERVAGGGEEALPRGRVLSYVANVSTPTRVRVVAARVLMGWGMIFIMGAMVIGWMVGKEIHREYSNRVTSAMVGPWIPALGARAVLPPPTLEKKLGFLWMAVKTVMARYWEPLPVMALMWRLGLSSRWFTEGMSLPVISVLGALGVTHFLLARGVRLGRRRASVLSAGLLVIPLVMLPVTTAVLAVESVYGFLDYLHHLDASVWPEVLTLAATLAGPVTMLVLKDTISFLRWIARQPSAEKPTVAFLPGGTR